MIRHFSVATFVVAENRVLMLLHHKLNKWLPPGGHIEPNELPDEAAVREVLEETGITIRLVGKRGLPIDDPRQLIIPQGIQVETIAPGHEHIDLVYFGRPEGSLTIRPNNEAKEIGWYGREKLNKLPLTDEIQMWTNKALDTLSPSSS